MTQKKRENFQLATQSEALAKKVATLEMECGVIKDENRVYKEDLATLKAKLDTEIEVLKREIELTTRSLLRSMPGLRTNWDHRRSSPPSVTIKPDQMTKPGIQTKQQR